jgi:hypothetical protein
MADHRTLKGVGDQAYRLRSSITTSRWISTGADETSMVGECEGKGDG